MLSTICQIDFVNQGRPAPDSESVQILLYCPHNRDACGLWRLGIPGSGPGIALKDGPENFVTVLHWPMLIDFPDRGEFMHRLIFVIALLAGQACADTYVCEIHGRRAVSTVPCGAGEKTIKTISDAPIAPGPVNSQSQADDFKRQLQQVQQNRADLQARNEAERPTPIAAPEPQRFNRQKACDDNWRSIQSIDASARQYSTDWHRTERKRLQDERWSLGC